MTPPLQVIVFDVDPCSRESGSVFLCVVVVEDDVVDDLPEFLSDFDLEVVAVVALVGVGAGGAGGTITVVAGGVAVDAAGSTKVPAVAPGRGSELAGDAWAGDDVASAEGRAEAASLGGDGGGTAVSGAAVTGSATSPSGPSGTDRAAWRARRTSG
jgi:hypothetical protein